MTPVFAVLAHDDPLMLRRLLSRLEGYQVAVHLDARVDLEDYEACARIRETPHVRYADGRVAVRWGGYSVVSAMMSAWRAAAEGADARDPVVFLSGHCYPIKPVKHLERFLAQSVWRQHCRAYDVAALGGWHRQRYQRRHWFDSSFWGTRDRLPRQAQRILRASLVRASSVRRLPETNLSVVAGSQWMVLTVECLRECADALDGPDYAIFRNSFAPDEMAIQSFVFNSRWREQTRFATTELIPNGKVSDLPNIHVLNGDMSGSADVQRIREARSQDLFFARKFSISDTDLLASADELTAQ